MGIVESTYAELKQQELKNNPYSCLHMADIDINPHQVEAFTFALSSLELGGAILADEVGLGKTIEAGLVIKYLLCSGKNKILLIMPSNLRKQWQVELEEKFDIDSLIVDSSNWEDYLAKVKSKQAVIIVSYHFASKRKAEFGEIAWDFCVFDEAHRLRNVYKNGSKMANSLYELTKGIPKILLTATPMQNTLLDIYGLVQFIDDRVFYSKQIFSERYLRGEDYNDLKACLEPVVQRTLRKEVAEYIQFSERKEMTIDFELSPMEIELYVMINNYLKKEILYALPNSHRTLITSVIRKLLASSSMAVAETFKVLKGRLETLKETTRTESADESIDFFLSFFDDDEIETDDDSKEENEIYPKYYETNVDLEIPGIQHGYLLIGGSYVGEIFEDAVFEIIDITGKIYGASDVLARELCEKLNEQCLEEETPNNQEILLYIDKVDEFMQQKYAESKRTVLIANQKKLDNWLQSRKEEYLLTVKDTSELDELKEKYHRTKRSR